jgi:hypothetical protein
MDVVVPTNNAITQRNCFNVLAFVVEWYLMHCSLPLERKAADLKSGPPPACGPPSAEATGGGPKPFALRPKAAFWRRVGGRRPEGFGPQGGGLHYLRGIKDTMSIINPIRHILIFESMMI